jgi:hypothetical protein
MKRFFIPLFVSLFAFQTLQAQDCEAYFPMKTGAMFELSSYNDKDKLQTVTTTTITEKESSADRIVSTAHAVVKDAKGKESSSVDYDVTCSEGAFKMDMRAFMSSQTMPQGLEGMEMHIEADEMAFPKGLSVGASLPDASFTMKATMNGMALMNTTMKSVNRKVVAKESVTTPAGTFDCIVIESDNQGSSMGMNFTSHSKSWFSLGVGMVRQESSRNGKMDSYEVLTKFSK